MSTEITDAITTNATGPKRVEADGVRVEQHDLSDQIEADKYTKATDGAALPSRGLRFSKLLRPRPES